MNVLIPCDANPGNTTVLVKNPAGSSTAVPITVATAALQFFSNQRQERPGSAH